MGTRIRALLDRLCERRRKGTFSGARIRRGAFIAPWDWRHRDKGTTVLGPLFVPITAQKQLLEPVSAEGAPSHDCIIKGNINREGERIYHMPGGNSYAKINMDVPGKRWFCSEDEAKAAGWRPAKR